MGTCSTKVQPEHQFVQTNTQQKNNLSTNDKHNVVTVEDKSKSSASIFGETMSNKEHIGTINDHNILSESDDDDIPIQQTKNKLDLTASDLHKDLSSIKVLSSNQFELDPLHSPIDSSSHSDHTKYTQILRVNQFDTLKKINDKKLRNILEHKKILYSSLLQVYPDNDIINHSSSIDVAGLLTHNNLYLVSAKHYNLWKLFEKRTKIDQLISDDVKIDHTMTKTLTDNFNLVVDQKLNEKISAFIRNKTKKEIQLDILFDDHRDPSFSTLFDLSDYVYDDISFSNTPSVQYSIQQNCIWKQFKEETNIDEILSKDNVKMDEDIVNTLIYMNDHDEKENMQYVINMKRYLLGKSKKDVENDIAAYHHKITSLDSLYQLKELKNIKQIIIHNFYKHSIIDKNIRDNFFEYLMRGINWVHQDRDYKSMIVEFEEYYGHSIIKLMNENKNEYFIHNNLPFASNIKISSYTNNKILNSRSESKIINLCKFSEIELYDGGFEHENSEGFKLINNDNEHVILLAKSNNIRHEWISHIDYAMYICCRPRISIFGKNKKPKKSIDKMMHDFSNTNTEEKFSNDFSFGQYFNYWESNYHNSLIPRYNTLKQELLKNKIRTISEKQYWWLYEESNKILKLMKHKLTAKYIGVNNKQFGIAKGTPITINHLITLKLYTDFTETQKQFKRQCRKYNMNESMSNFMTRHAEVGHWCRYLKECCQFYGKKMKKKDVVYTGLKQKLLFNSMKQHFECPLSTTTDANIAQVFSEDKGIILKLKAANYKTRYFDVSCLSQYPQENERLCMGSSLKICDIYINAKSSAKYIAALQMLEQIINGQFNDSKHKTETELYLILSFILGLNKNIILPDYILQLFMNMIQKMQRDHEWNQLWINRYELEKIHCEKLKCMFIGCGEFFNYFGIQLCEIKQIQRFVWKIDANVYDRFKKLGLGQYIKSENYQYINVANQNEKIVFYLKSCFKYSHESRKCALFLYLDSLPTYIEAIQVEYNLLCDELEYSHIATPQWLSMNKPFCGFQTFTCKALNKYLSLTWKVAIKIIDRKYYSSDMDDDVKYDNEFNDIVDVEKFQTALKHNNKTEMMEIVKSLVKKQNELRNECQHLKQVAATVSTVSVFSGNSGMSS